MKPNSIILLLTLLVLMMSCHEPISKQSEIKLNPKEKLGHYLFFENKLSLNHTKSCASCHSPEFAFTDGYRKSITSLGENVLHNAPSLLNATFLHYFEWANPAATSFEKQIQRPLYSSHPIELGLNKHLEELQAFFNSDSMYTSLFQLAFPNEDTLFSPQQIEESLVSYEKQLISTNAAFDKNSMSISAQKGYQLFSALHCIKCHPPPYFTLATTSNNIDSVYVNIGLYNVGNSNKYPLQDNGIYLFTKKESDDGKFKIPSLRNVMHTSPYMHDGSVNTIEEVIEIYARSGRNITYGDYQGDGAINKNKNPLINGFTLSNEEKMYLLNFLEALSDSTIRENAIFQNPF